MKSPFAIVPVEVFMDDQLTKIELRVLGAILTFRNRDTNLSRPTRSQIGQRCGYNERTVSKATTSLAKKGWLSKVGKGGSGIATTYKFTVPDDEETVSDSGTVPGSGTKPCPVRAQNPVRTGHTNLPNKPNKKKATQSAPSRLLVASLPEEWRMYCEEKRPDLRPDAVFEDFADHYRSQPGDKGVRECWLSTWRKWVREQKAKPHTAKSPGGPEYPDLSRGSGDHQGRKELDRLDYLP